ncbi:MAG: hypothetical protein WD577_05990 [Bacteroidales bacterium]
MLLKLIKSNRPSGILFLFFLMILLWFRCFIDSKPHTAVIAMPLYDLLFGTLQQSHIASCIVSMLIFGLLLPLIIRFNIIHFLLEERTYMPAIFYLMLTASYPPALQLNPILISAPFLLIALLMLIRGDEHRADPMALFNASLVLAAGSLFFLKILWFIPFLWITATIIRPLKWRGIINPLLVLIILLLFSITYYWVFRDNLSLLETLLKENLSLSHERFYRLETPQMVLYGYLLILFIISSTHLLSRYQFRKIIIRKLYLVLFILFVYVLLFALFISTYTAELTAFLAIPLAYLFSNFFYRRKNHWIQELFILIWVGMLAYVHITTTLVP